MAAYLYPADFAGTQWSVFDGDIYVSSTAIPEDLGDGSPANPFPTIQKALDACSDGNKIVIGTGLYIEHLIGHDHAYLHIVSDGLVILDGNGIGGVLLSEFLDNCRFEELQIINYDSVCYFGPDVAAIQFNNCIIKDCTTFNASGVINNTLVLNTPVFAINEVVLEKCTLMITVLGATSQNNFKIIQDCIFGRNCVVEIDHTLTQYFDYCNFEPGSIIKIDGTSFSSPGNVHASFSQYHTYSLNIISGFNNMAMDDYSLNSQSQLINAGSLGQNIGAFQGSISFHNSINQQSSSMLDNATFTNIVSTPEGNYTILPPHTYGTIETVEIDLGDVVPLGKVNIFAGQDFETPPYNAVVDVHNNFIYPNILTYEMRYSDIAGETSLMAYKEFEWNTLPMIDRFGKGNGNSNFDFSSASSVWARYVQLRITLRDETFFLLNEDESYILQENGYKIILEF